MEKQNVTLSIPKVLLRQAKIIASSQDKSLSQFLKESLEEKVREESDYNKAQKDSDIEVITQIYLFPLIQMFCETKKGKKFEIYSLGSANKFMIYSNF